jgi:hypothetical protein
MSLAADPRYRNIRLEWLNNSYKGNEVVQLFAKPAGGIWANVVSYGINGDDQLTAWATALPLTLYSLALRYVNGTTPTVGFEGSDPSLWTSPFAAGAQTTVTTGCTAPIWGSVPAFVNAATPITLVWTNAQTGVPYLLEKSTDGGATFSTIVAGLIANAYAYVIPPAEVGLTTRFRLTAQNGTIIGPSAGVILVPMLVTVGTPTWVSASFTPATAIALLQWSAASIATGYLIEKTLNGGASWITVATPAGTSYSYSVPDAEINTTVGFRVTGTSGSVNGSASTTQNLAMTVTIGTTTLSAGALNGRTGQLTLTATAAANATAYSYEKSTNGGATWTTWSTGNANEIYIMSLADVNTSMQFRVTPKYRTVAGTTSNVVTVAMTVSVGTGPSTVVVTGYSATGGTYGLGYASLTWTPATSTDIYFLTTSDGSGGRYGDATAGPTDTGSGKISKYSTPQASVKVVVEIAGNAIEQASGLTVLAWP